MKISMAVAATLFFMATPALAEDWQFVGKAPAPTPKRILFFIDKASIRPLANGRKWVRALQYFETPMIPGVTAIDAEQEIDCTARRGTMIKVDGLRADGTTAMSERPTAVSFTVVAAIDRVVCQGDWSVAVSIGRLPVMEAARRLIAKP